MREFISLGRTFDTKSLVRLGWKCEKLSEEELVYMVKKKAGLRRRKCPKEKVSIIHSSKIHIISGSGNMFSAKP